MLDGHLRHTALRPAIVVVIVLAVVAYSVALLPAQTFFGSIVGTVADPTGAVVPGAPVTLINTGTAEQHRVVTDDKGNYQFANLVPGVYKIDIAVAGYKHLTQEAIQVQVQATVRINCVLVIGAATEVVQVTSQAPLLQTESSSLSQVVEGRTVQDMPLNGRNVLNLIALVPGVVAQNGSSGSPMGNLLNGQVTTPVGWGNYQIGGGQANQSAMFYDGVPVNSSFANATVLVPVQDAVQEFRVSSSAVSPEFGRFAGGVVNMTTKSGSNQFHGALYEYFRNKVLNANDFFNNQNAQPRPAFNQNQYGANATGPIIKDKLFFMFGWEDFKLRIGEPTQTIVPTDAERIGDFSASDFPTIYDPTTTCSPPGHPNIYNNPPCAVDGSGNPIYERKSFPGNKIPANRINPTAKYMLTYWLPPNLNQPDNPNNFTKNGSGGGDQYQINTRIDQIIGDKQRLFGRYTRWVGNSIPNELFNNLYTATSMIYMNNNAVLGDTYTLTPTTILDVRLSFMRFSFQGHQLDDHHDFSLYGPNWAPLNNELTFRTFAALSFNGSSNTQGFDEWATKDLSNNEALTVSLTKIMGRHTLKFGGESRFLEWRHADSAPPGPLFNFDDSFTANEPTSETVTGGWDFASFLLGDIASASARTLNYPSQRMWYHGAFLNDAYQVNSKLTLNLGVRWEYPGSWYERKDLATVLQPTAANPLAQKVGLPLKGNIVLVNSADYQSRNIHPAKWGLFGPRVGVAYRLNDKTVIRAGYGISYLPSDAVISNAPWMSPTNFATTTVTSSRDGGVTPFNTLDNPFPNGVLQPPGRNATALASSMYGTDVQSPVSDQPYPYVGQWNLTIQRELPGDTAFEIGYAGSKGTHMPLDPVVGRTPTFQMNQLPDQYLSMGSDLTTLVSNPFYLNVPDSAGILAQPTITKGQLLRPMPQYMTVSNSSNMEGNSSYNSLQTKLEKRFKTGASLLAAYTFSKMLGNSDATSSWTENYNGSGTFQNWNNIRAEKSLSSYDLTHNFVVNFMLDLPVGKGRKFLNGVSGVADKLVSGWAISGIARSRNGYPLVFHAQPTILSRRFGAGAPRPNVVAGCNNSISGNAESRLNGWFNKACFSQPGQFAFGNEPRTDRYLRSDGNSNFDLSISKNTSISELVKVRFEAQALNLANHPWFMPPATTVGAGNFGHVFVQRNQPRLVQFALRVTF